MDEPRTRKRYHHGDLYASLVEAAGRLLERDGAGNLSLRETAKAVGVSHAAPYRHFRDKQALLEAVAVAGFDELIDALVKAVADHPSDPRSQLEDACLAYLRVALERPNRTHLMFGGHLDRSACSSSFLDASATALQSLRNVIRHGKEIGTFRQGSTRDFALYVWSAIHGLAMLAVAAQLQGLTREGESLEDMQRTVLRQTLDGLIERGD